MSVYRPKHKDGTFKTPYWHYDFVIAVLGRKPARRFYGSTGQKTKRSAEAVEARLRELAAVGQMTSDMTVDQACLRYWTEISEAKRSAADQERNLELVCELLGPETLLVAVTPDLIADAAARRARTPIIRMQRIGTKLQMAPTKHMPTGATVNRQFIDPIKGILRRAKKVWQVPIDLDIFDWSALTLEKAAPRTRELSIEEELRFWEALRPDYHPICEMYIISGRRRSDWVMLSKFRVDLKAGTVRMPTRKRKEVGELIVELTDREIEIIREEMNKAPKCEYVFTYEVPFGPAAGERRPLTAAGLRRRTDKAFKKANIEDFRRHDFRHTFASRALRGKGDLRTLMAAMDHQDIKSTARYAHMARGQAKDMRAQVTTSRNYPGSTNADNVVKLKKSEADQ
jgi:integrase